MAGWFRIPWAHPSAILLIAQLLGVLLYPFFDDSPVGRALLSLFSLAVLVLAVRAVRSTPAWTWVAILLGVPVVALTILEAVFYQNATIILWSAVLHAAFYFYTSYGLLRYLFKDRFVTPDELWATGATFTVLAWAFAYVYVAAQVIWPGSFTAAVDPSAPRSWIELLFLSFTTLTSTGLSDVLPILPNARSLVMIEQVAGLMYVALVISRVVGLTLFRERARVERLASDIDHAEPVALGVGQDHVVGVGRALVPVHLGRSEADEPSDLARLVIGVEVEVDARRDRQRRANAIQRHVGAVAVSRVEE